MTIKEMGQVADDRRQTRKWRNAPGMALAVAMISGMAGTATAIPAPDQLFALYATHTFGGVQQWCGGTDNLCLSDTSSPSFSLTRSGAGTTLTASGAHAPNALSSYFYVDPAPRPSGGNELGEVRALRNAMFDTYTLAGPAGPVDITLNVHLTGNIAYTGFTNTGFADAQFAFVAGARNQNYTPGISNSVIELFQRFITLQGHASTVTFLCNPFPACPLGAIDRTGSATLTVTPGTPFEIGYDLLLRGIDSTMDFGHTLSIDFVLPQGYSLSSALGWTDPDLASTGIPAPAGLPLLAAGLVLLMALRRPPARPSPK